MNNQITNMAADQIDRFNQITDRNKRTGVKNPVLAALVETLEPSATKPATKPVPATAPAAKVRPAPPANPLSNKTDTYLQQMASHRSSPITDQALAIAELKRRGITYSNGCFSRSTRNA